MAADAVIATMNTLIAVHQDLNQQAKKKTAMIKNEDIEKLSSLLQEEEALAARLAELEEARRGHVREVLRQQGSPDEDVELTQLSAYVSEAESETLLALREQLLAEIADLKQQNELNQELISQSLQFVHVSLDLLQPAMKTGNYERPGQAQARQQSQSLFDTRA